MQKTYYLVSGGFDPIHEGHIAMIKASATASDGVIVLLNSDNWLARKKGKPFMTFKTRKAICENLKGVIEVIAFNDDDDSASDGIRLARAKYPDCKLVFANGGDRHSGNIRETDTCAKYQVELAFGVGGEEKINASSWILKCWYDTGHKQQRKIIHTIKLYLVRSLCCLIPAKTLRHRIRSTLIDVRLSDISSYIRFYHQQISSKSVLLIETNNSHGEVLPGYVAYFQELGYRVSVLLNANLNDSRPLCRIASKLAIFPASEALLKHLLASPRLHCYQHLLLNTASNYGYNPAIVAEEPMFVVEKYPFLQQHQSLLVVEHELNNLLTGKEDTILQQNHLLTLGKFNQGLMVNPHNFGTVTTHKQSKEITNFIVVGNISSQRKNHTALLTAITKLYKLHLAFKVTIIGRGNMDFVSAELQPYIDYKGSLDFPQMYQAMETAHFFLPLLDADDPRHDRYITTGVTGSAQLIYGFLTPAVIHAKFADFYRFNQQNSIIYQQDLAMAMQTAIAMNDQEYQTLQQALATTVQAIKNESMANLQLACNSNNR